VPAPFDEPGDAIVSLEQVEPPCCCEPLASGEPPRTSTRLRREPGRVSRCECGRTSRGRSEGSYTRRRPMCCRVQVQLAVHNADMTSRRLREEHPWPVSGQRLCRHEVRPWGLLTTRAFGPRRKFWRAMRKMPRAAMCDLDR
jgi:hypothetical protein